MIWEIQGKGQQRMPLKAIKKPEVTVMIVEGFANDKVEDNLNPLGDVFLCHINHGMYSSIIEPKWTGTRCTRWRA